VKVERKWPSELVIYVEERKLLVRLKDNNQSYLVDSQGQVIKDNLSALTVLPVVTGMAGSDAKLPELVVFLQKLRKLDKEIFTRIAGLIWRPDTGLVAQLADGSQLYWGEMDEDKLPEKLALLRLVTRDMQDKGITSQYIDLRFKNVVVKPKQS
jgi:cell division septal protein FtsQ